ncbi:MAG: hypothetical protein J6B90_10045 [Lachnospiraceae bacterium]|nr:hypothetical protein [Lachnospiraceae bacterium]
MKLKYYLRGLGIGILVTIIIVVVSGAGKNTMTDEEIKDRARELGMIESTVLAPSPSVEPDGTETPKPDTEPEATETLEPSAEPEATETPEPSAEPEATETPRPSTEPEVTETPEPSTEPEVTETPKPSTEPEETTTPNDNVGTGETVTIVIANGESSVTVSKTLEAAGLIESASDYDRYLCDNGYDKKIRTGTYEIPVGADEEEIALIITRRN